MSCGTCLRPTSPDDYCELSGFDAFRQRRGWPSLVSNGHYCFPDHCRQRYDGEEVAFEWQARGFDGPSGAAGPDESMKPLTNGIGSLRLFSLLASFLLPTCRLT